MRRIILRILGWKIIGQWPPVPRSIVTVAPHTSYLDGFIGYLAMGPLGIKYRILADERLFHFPMSILMRIIQAHPVNVKGRNAIFEVEELLKSSEKMNVVICPEGQLAPTDKWQGGFLLMARRAGVPVIGVGIDYAKKEIQLKGLIEKLDDSKEVFKTLSKWYEGCTGRHPEKFLLPEKNIL